MFKTIVSTLALFGFMFQIQVVFGQYTISATETVYSGGSPTTSLFTCEQDSIVYSITESPFTTDSIKIKLPDGITFVNLHSESNVVATYTVSAYDSVPTFKVAPTAGTFTLSLLVNTPPCNSEHSKYDVTHIWGLNSTDTAKLNSDLLTINNPSLSATDISWPNPMVLNVGNVGEFVLKLANTGDVGSEISKIYFQVTPTSNIYFYPVGHPMFYLTNADSVPNKYYTKYNYNLPVHNKFNLDTTHTDSIDATEINSVTGKAYLGQHDTIILHVPFFVKNCDNNVNGEISVYTECPLNSVQCNLYNDVTTVGVELGTPSLSATVDTIDNSTFCSSINKHSSEIRFKYSNNGSRLGSDPGNARADSLRLYMYCNTGTGIIDTATVKINTVPVSSHYITPYTSGGMNIYLVDLTKYPAGVSGHPFGINTIYDMNGRGYADALAEDSTFEISATFYYDSISCPPFDQCASVETPNTFYLPAIWSEYNNQCFTSFYNRNDTLRYYDSIGRDAEYMYQSSNGLNTSVSAPADVTNSSPDFNLDVCPSYNQTWSPSGFNFYCPDAQWYFAIPLPVGYHLNFSSADLSYVESGHTHLSSIYTYTPVVHDSGGCSHSTFSINSPFPLVDEHFHADSTQDTVFVNFGRLPLNNCGPDSATNLLLCMNVPLSLDCGDMPHNSLYTENSDNLSFTLQYSCDSGCSACSNILSCGSTITYHHCPGYCSSIPYTDSAWSFLRIDSGLINQNISIPKYYTTNCSSSYEVIPGLPDSLRNKSVINLEAAYPGDQIVAKVNGGYDSLIPSHFSNEYLQIRYEYLTFAPQDSVFQLDPTDSSYFIIRGCVGVPGLNGIKLYLPKHAPTTYYSAGSPVEMDFSLPEAIQHTSSALYSLWIADNDTERITDTAVIHLRVLNGPNYEEYPDFFTCGKGIAHLRTEFMCTTISTDTIHSCDSWGKSYTLLQPCSSVELGASPVSNCDSFPITFVFGAGNALSSYNQDDFPYEFRPFAELDSVVTITLPQGYVYGTSKFYADMDNFDSADYNYFSGGSLRHYFTATPVITHPFGPSGITVLTYKGLSTSCWPLIDQKFDSYYNETPSYNLVVNTKPECTAAAHDSIFYSAGFKIGTQQSDTDYQETWKTTHDVNDFIKVQHENPTVILNAPPTTSDSSNLITFTFILCDSAFTVSNGWVAFQNVLGDDLNLTTANLYDVTTATTYTGTTYRSDTGIIFNFGSLTGCNTFIFSAIIDSNSKSCPPPVGGDSGRILVRYGNLCNGTLSNPDSTTCENRADTFYYITYPANLQLTNNGQSPDTLSLCAGVMLVDSLTITSDDLGTISNPEFWITPPPGVTFDTAIFTYPCGGSRDTNIHVPDTSVYLHGGTVASLGWNLNKDLRLDGLRGTLGLPPLSDSNTICVIVKMTLNCGYHGKPIPIFTTGVTTCDIVDTAKVSFTPVVDSSCCPHRCFAYNSYDTTLINPDAKTLARAALHNPSDSFKCKTILIEGTFKVDTTFNINACNISLAPGALINIVDSSTLRIEEGACGLSCSHLHAACDSMWRGIFIHKGSTLFTIDETLIEDADTAVYAINTSTQQALYNLNVSTFNKNYKDIVVKPYPGIYNGTSYGCLYTCRNFDSILSSAGYNCVDPQSVPSIDYYGNWITAPFDTLLIPHAGGQNTYIGWQIDTVGYLSDSLSTILLAKGFNTFDNMQYGIYSLSSNTGIYTDLFQNMVNTNSGKAAITARGNASIGGNKLWVGGPPKSSPLSNTFLNCTTGVYADSGFNYVDVAYNKMSNTSAGAYGVAVAVMNISGDSLFIDQDSITNFNIGIACDMNNYVNGYINYNTISENICSNLNWTGIVMNESASSVNNHYIVDSNTIGSLYRGIYGNGLYSPYIDANIINIGPFTCSSYLNNGVGILLQDCNVGQIGCNDINTGFTPNTYTGIEESNSSSVTIMNNDVTNADIHIIFNGGSNTGDNLFNNTLNTGDTAIFVYTGSTMAEMGTASQSSDNNFSSFTCETATPAFPYPIYYYSTGYLPTSECPAITNTHKNHGTPDCASILSRSRSHSAIRHEAYDSTSFDSTTIAYMESIALSKDTFSVMQDTNIVLAKEGLLNILWGNSYLLNNPIFNHFNDSMSNAPMGKIMAVDSGMTDSIANSSTLLNTLNAINPANNIEANLQAATQGYLLYRLNGGLSTGELTTLRTLANKCSYWDGNGVYEARALLSLFDPPSTVYSDVCGSREQHKPVKNNSSNQNPVPAFELYPNPNNGNFTLEYSLGNGEVGKVMLFNTMGEQIGEYDLNGSEGVMNVSNPNLSNGVYLWKLYSNNQMIKYGKVVIMK